ncbi:MAG TPA: hypothetical protein VHK69_05610, partial [Chitinophagaceae bacterium]|nr:hypothetical protein [Chitinophagaceae bacterium]
MTSCRVRPLPFLTLLFFWFLLPFAGAAQAVPANDACTGAGVIAVPNGGYGLGKFVSATADLTKATVQPGESFAPAIVVAGQNKKSVWYKFSLGTTRSVRVTLKQPGVDIAAGDVGFTVYQGSKCLPAETDLSSKLTPIALFGETFHPCVDEGEYYIQISARAGANGPVFLQLDVDQPVAPYDRPSAPSEFGKLAQHTNTAIDFDVECQSLEDATETCIVNGKDKGFQRSTWHTFTTPAYFDYLALLMAKHASGSGTHTVGYRLYKGDVKTAGRAGLQPVGDCDTLILRGYYAGVKTWNCGQLDPNTTYTVQFLYRNDFIQKVRLSVQATGTGAAAGPEPKLSKIGASNRLGVLKTSNSGARNDASDKLACNTRHTAHPCAYAQPAAGIDYNGQKYNLSTFFTFELPSMSKVNFYAYAETCGPTNVRMRLYRKPPTENCGDLDAASLVQEFDYYEDLDCLPAGKYTLQVMGRDTAYDQSFYYASLGDDILCIRYHLGMPFDLTLTVQSVKEGARFSLKNKTAYDGINAAGGVLKPLVPGTVYTAVKDTFGCENSVLPESACTTVNGYAPTKAMYRQLAVADSGILTMSNAEYPLYYKLFKGDAAALATAQNAYTYPKQLKGLED